MKPSPAAAFLLGAWLGASVLLFAVVGYSFAGIKTSMEINEKLEAKAGFDADDDGARKTSVLWVYASELNRAYFYGWNRAQLALACLTLLVVLIRSPRAWPVLLILMAAVIVLALTFYLAPEVTRLGRELDFVPRDPAPAPLAAFNRLHRLYTFLELGKVALLGFAAVLLMRASPPRPVEG